MSKILPQGLDYSIFLVFWLGERKAFDKKAVLSQYLIMTDVENLEKIILGIFGVEKKIKNRGNTNRCIQPLNRYPLNMFAFNFMNRLSRLNEKFCGDIEAINTICERVKNLGEAGEAGWAGPYCELVALDFYSQFSEFMGISYINVLDITRHKKSLPFLNGQKEKIDIDICLSLKKEKLFTDVKSFNCVHQLIFDKIFESVERYASKEFGKSILVGVENLSSLDFIEVKNTLVKKRKEIEETLKDAIQKSLNFVSFSSDKGLELKFRIGWPGELSTVRDYSPFAMAQAYKYKFLDYQNKLIDDEYSLITMVKNPWFNEETVDFGHFNNIFYRSLSRRTFMELLHDNSRAQSFSSACRNPSIKVCDVSKSLAGIVFIDDNSVRSKYFKSLYSAYIYLNPNYACKKPLTIRSMEKYFRNGFEVQIKDFDDFKWDNY